MSDEPGPVSRDGRAQVRRVDEGLGLAVARLPLSARTLVNYTRDHVAVRTPSRPHEPSGNSLDLMAPPVPEEVGRWVERFAETVGRVGARHTCLRWELPAGEPADGRHVGEELDTALAEHGLRVSTSTALLLDGWITPRAAPAELVPVEPPTSGGRATDRRWHAATVLYRYATGTTPEEWRDWDEDRVAWKIEVQRELAVSGRARVWLALRHGAPVARLTVHHDRQGLAGVDDLVVHPAHRQLGIASALTHAAVEEHLAEHGGAARIGVAVGEGAAEHLARGLGFADHATIVTATDRPDEGGR